MKRYKLIKQWPGKSVPLGTILNPVLEDGKVRYLFDFSRRFFINYYNNDPAKFPEHWEEIKD